MEGFPVALPATIPISLAVSLLAALALMAVDRVYGRRHGGGSSPTAEPAPGERKIVLYLAALLAVFATPVLFDDGRLSIDSVTSVVAFGVGVFAAGFMAYRAP